MHTLTVGIREIIFLEGEKGIARRQYKWRLRSLLNLSNVWKPYQSNQRKKIEESQEIARDARLEVRDELFTIGDS